MTEGDNETTSNLRKAHTSANFMLRDLCLALNTSGAVEGLILRQLVDRAATMAGEIERLLHAVIDNDIIDKALAKAKEPTP